MSRGLIDTESQQVKKPESQRYSEDFPALRDN